MAWLNARFTFDLLNPTRHLGKVMEIAGVEVEVAHSSGSMSLTTSFDLELLPL
jgi:hypothetical protein